MKNPFRDYSKYMAIEPYLLSNSVVVGANSTNTLTFTIDANYDYEWSGFFYKATGEFKFQPVIDQKQLFKNYVNNYGFAGRVNTTQIGMNLWYRFRVPFICSRNTTITLNLTDLSGSSNTIEFTFDGLKCLYNT